MIGKRLKHGVVFVTVVLGAAVLIRLLFAPVIVVGPSMEPTYTSGELLITAPAATLSFGDVVVLKEPSVSRSYIIKRIVGVPGDTLIIYNGELYRNGEKVPLQVDEIINNGGVLLSETTLLEDEYFVMGDNVNHSSDGRMFGPVARKDIKYVVKTVLLHK